MNLAVIGRTIGNPFYRYIGCGITIGLHFVGIGVEGMGYGKMMVGVLTGN